MMRDANQKISYRGIENVPKGADMFFRVFSRFEYALKESKFAYAGKEGRAEVDWKGFVSRLDVDMGSTTFFEHVNGSGRARTLVDRPPKRQVYENKVLDFKDVSPPADTRQLLWAVQRVRNNLFHGGKTGEPDADVNDPNRNKTLIAEAQWVLEEALRYNRDVRHKFEGWY